MSIDVFERGDNVRIKGVVKDTQGNATQPDLENGTAKIFVEIADVNSSTTYVSKATMDSISTTQYKYDWQTTEGIEKGEIEVEVSASVSQQTALNRERIDLTDIIL